MRPERQAVPVFAPAPTSCYFLEMQSSIISDETGSGVVNSSTPMLPWPALAPFGHFLAKGLPGGVSGLHYFDSAPGDRSRKTIVLIHGLGDEGDSFRHLYASLADQFRLVAPDLPGFGRSTAKGGVTFAMCVESVATLLGSLAIEGAVVLGSSLGASVAQRLQLRHPALVSALFLEDGGAPAPGRPANGLLAMALPVLGERYYRGFRDNHEAAVRSLSPYYGDWKALPEADRNFLSRRVVDRVMSEPQARAYLSLLRSAIAAMVFSGASFARQLAAFRGPVLVAWGERDIIVAREAGRAVAARAGDARFEVIEGAGHLPHQERPEAVAKLLRELADTPVRS